MNRGKMLCEELKKANIRNLVWLPDSETHFMHDAMLSDPEIKITQVCREGEAVAICAGFHIGGQRSAVLVESQGIFECGNILKWCIEMDMPVLLMIGYFGYKGLTATPQGRVNKNNRKDFTEPFLDAYGIRHHLVDTDEDVKKVGPAYEETLATHRPVALLLTCADGFVPGT